VAGGMKVTPCTCRSSDTVSSSVGRTHRPKRNHR
jgi:hypothetical protein